MTTTSVDDRALELAASRAGAIVPADLVAEGIVRTRTTGFRVLADLEAVGLMEWTRKGWAIKGDPS